MSAKVTQKMADLDLSSDEEDWDAEMEEDEELDLSQPAKTIIKKPSVMPGLAGKAVTNPSPAAPPSAVKAGPRRPITTNPVGSSAGPSPAAATTTTTTATTTSSSSAAAAPSKGPTLISPEMLKTLMNNNGGKMALKTEDFKKLTNSTNAPSQPTLLKAPIKKATQTPAAKPAAAPKVTDENDDDDLDWSGEDNDDEPEPVKPKAETKPAQKGPRAPVTTTAHPATNSTPSHPHSASHASDNSNNKPTPAASTDKPRLSAAQRMLLINNRIANTAAAPSDASTPTPSAPLAAHVAITAPSTTTSTNGTAPATTATASGGSAEQAADKGEKREEEKCHVM